MDETNPGYNVTQKSGYTVDGDSETEDFSGATKPIHTYIHNEVNKTSRIAKVSTVSDYRLEDRVTEVRSPAEERNFNFLFSLCVQTGSDGGPPSLLTNGYRGSFPQG
jgi:hypothetical protein